MELKGSLFAISDRQSADLYFPTIQNYRQGCLTDSCRMHAWLGVALAYASLSGCMGFDAISNEARPGGTVLVAVDAVRYEMPDPSRVQATFFDREGAEHPVSLRHLLRVQPDPISGFGLGQYSTNKGLYAGQKLAIVDLVDPLTQLPPTAPAMASGEGVLELYMPDLEQSSAHGLKILPADAFPEAPANDLRVLQNAEALRPLHSAWMLQASPLPHVRVETIASEVFNKDTHVAGAVFILRYRKQDFVANSTSPGFAINKLSGDPNLQLSWQSNDHDPDYGELVITLRNPHGFSVFGAQMFSASKQSIFEDLSSIAIGWLSHKYRGETALPFTWASPPMYFDVHGNVVEGLSASMQSGGSS